MEMLSKHAITALNVPTVPCPLEPQAAASLAQRVVSATKCTPSALIVRSGKPRSVEWLLAKAAMQRESSRSGLGAGLVILRHRVTMS